MNDTAGAQADRETAGGGKRGRRRAGWVLLLLLVIAAAGYFVFRGYFAHRETTDDAQIDGHIHPVAAKVSGQVRAMLVVDNQFVRAGTVLVEIDPRDYQVALSKAEADLAAARSALNAARTQVPLTLTTTSSRLDSAAAGVEQAEAARTMVSRDVEASRAKLEAVRAQVRAAEASHTRALRDLERMKLLIVKDEVSRQQYDAAVAAEDAARADVDALRAGVEESLQSVAAAEARVEQAGAGIREARANQQASRTRPEQMAISRSNMETAAARVKQAEAVVARAQLDLEYTRVRAPIDGYVSQRKTELGQYVQVGQPLMALVPLGSTWVTANYKENQLENMHPGQRAVVSVDAYGGRRFEGRVDSIAAATGARFSLLPPENATGNFVKVVQRVPVKILIEGAPDADYPLRPGLSVIATVYTGDAPDKTPAPPAGTPAPPAASGE